jgi:SAM-dependent methyltransferase
LSWKSSILAFASRVAPRLSSRVLASTGYTLDPSKLRSRDGFSTWSAATARRQDRSWQAIVAEAKAGHPRHDVVALYEALGHFGGAESVLEIGCGGGYFSELIVDRFPQLSYRGLDLSPAMIELARGHYPDREFVVGSAYELPFPDGDADIVMDGVALIHMPSWQTALAEYARVASRGVVLHGLTVTDTSPTTEFAKYAYGQPSLELVFNRAELVAACQSVGLRQTATVAGLDYDLEKVLGIRSVEETWVLEPR